MRERGICSKKKKGMHLLGKYSDMLKLCTKSYAEEVITEEGC